MVAYDPIIKGFLPFGTLKLTSVNEDEHENSQLSANVDINDPTKPHPCCKFVTYYQTVFC